MAGQYLDMLEQATAGTTEDDAVESARTVIRYKSAKYTIEHPLLLGGTLAGAPRLAAGRLLRLRPAAGRGVPAARRPARRVRRPVGDRQARRRRPARGQADRARRPGHGAGDPRAGLAGPAAARRPRPGHRRRGRPAGDPPRHRRGRPGRGPHRPRRRGRDGRPGRGRRGRRRPRRCSRAWSSRPPPAAPETAPDHLTAPARIRRGGPHRTSEPPAHVDRPEHRMAPSSPPPASPAGCPAGSAPSTAPPTTSSSSAPGSPGCPRPCASPAPGARSPCWSARTSRAGARASSSRTPRTAAGSTASTTARPCSPCRTSSPTASTPSARTCTTGSTWSRCRPLYRAFYADGSPPRRPRRHRGDVRGDRAGHRPGRGGGLPPLRRLRRQALQVRDAGLHRPQHRHPARPAHPQPRPAGGHRRVRQARPQGRAVPQGPPHPARLLLPGAVRRREPVRRPRHLRRHRLHGLRRGGVRGQGRDERDPAGHGRRGREARRRHPLRHDRDQGRAHRRPRQRRHHEHRRAHRRRHLRPQPRPARRPPRPARQGRTGAPSSSPTPPAAT